MTDHVLPSESLLSAIVKSSDDAIVSKDLNGIVTSWNSSAERMFGFSAAEMLGRSIRTIIPAERQSEEDQVLARIRAGDVIDHFETVRQRKDGSHLAVSLSVSPIRNEFGVVVGASKIARDISERVRARAIARRARRQADFVARLGAAFSTTMGVSERLSELATLAVPELADFCAIDIVQPNGHLDRLMMRYIDPSKIAPARRTHDRYDGPRSTTSPAHVARTGQPAIFATIADKIAIDSAAGDEEQLTLVRQLGLVSYLCLPLIVNGQTFGALTFATAESGRSYDEDDIRFVEDVARRAALAMDNARSYEQLQAANQLKDEFLATLSHELRTPLNAILGYARMLRAGMLKDERKANALETLERNATTLTQIVEDVLDISRIASGKIRLNVQTVDLGIVLRDALSTITPAADAKGVRIESILESHPGPVSGDPDRLQQVLWNLLSNAVKFTPRAGRVQVRLQRVNSHVEINVSDTGIGIRDDFLPHIFERFRQADSTTTRKHGGLGLGLAIAHEIVELHGGTIHATSGGPGQGCTFVIQLPVMIVHPEAKVSEPRVHPRVERHDVPAEFARLPGICVLVVDDDGDALMLVREILEAAGAEVLAATSALAALTVLEHRSPDVLISDLGMPATDGFELIHRVRQLADAKRDIPAAALTAYARSEDRARALQAGFEMHLAKPIDPGELIAAVASLARRRRVPAT